MRKFIQEVVIPRLSEIEVRRMNVAELRVLKKVNKALGKAIAEVLAGASVQGQVNTSVLKELVQKQVIARTVQGSQPAEPQAERQETRALMRRELQVAFSLEQTCQNHVSLVS